VITVFLELVANRTNQGRVVLRAEPVW